jgi:septum formation protein
LKNKFILASGSPRRKELLKLLDIDFTIEVSDICEDFKEGLTNEEIVMDLAFQKAKDISQSHKGKYVLGFDTLVILDGVPLGKPSSRMNAFDMLERLSNRTHTVLTGCAIVKEDYKDVFFTATDVTFFPLSKQEINQYIDSFEPFDKAGAYGIQGSGAKFIKEIKGDYYSVMGLPVSLLYQKIRGFI